MSLTALGACSKAVFKVQMPQAGAAFPHSPSISGSKHVAHPLGAEGRGVVAIIKASACSQNYTDQQKIPTVEFFKSLNPSGSMIMPVGDFRKAMIQVC